MPPRCPLFSPTDTVWGDDGRTIGILRGTLRHASSFARSSAGRCTAPVSDGSIGERDMISRSLDSAIYQSLIDRAPASDRGGGGVCPPTSAGALLPAHRQGRASLRAETATWLPLCGRRDGAAHRAGDGGVSAPNPASGRSNRLFRLDVGRRARAPKPRRTPNCAFISSNASRR